MGWSQADEDIAEGRKAGLKQAANWLRRQANAEKEPKAKAAFIEAHNAILAMAASTQAEGGRRLRGLR